MTSTAAAPPRPSPVPSSASDAGFVAVSARPGACPARPLREAVASVLGAGAEPVTAGSGPTVTTWGDLTGLGDLSTGRALLLTGQARHRDAAADPARVGRALRERRWPVLREMLPAFGALAVHGGTVSACTDALGFRQIFWTQGDGWAAVSTSARLLASLGRRPLDRGGVAAAALVGWQLEHRTLFEGVEQLPAGTLVELADGRARPHTEPAPGAVALSAGEAVHRGARVLRDWFEAFLDENHDPVLQLTGGQDSRLLLSSIDPRRRAGLRVMTLGDDHSEDVRIARQIAHRWRLDHEVLTLDGLDHLTPHQARERCRTAAGRLELGADPVARAALDHAESRAATGVRISGLGGEVARGFYYLGRAPDVEVSPRRVRQLVAWRLTANERVGADVLEESFEAEAREGLIGRVDSLLRQGGLALPAATDRFYLDQRMQRWAGATESAVCLNRPLVNPMLDDRFLAVVAGLDVAAKRGSRFLAALQVELDPELAGMALDGRPAPSAICAPSIATRGSQVASVVSRGSRKLAQRVRGGRRPPLGGGTVAALVAEQWRADPTDLDDVAALGVVRQQWLEQVALGAVEPSPTDVAFLVNVSMAVQAAGRAGGGPDVQE